MASLLFLTTAFAGSPTERLLLRGDDALQQLGVLVVGAGIDGTEGSTGLLCDGSTMAWQRIDGDSDELGMRHVFWQQVLLPGPDLAAVLPGQYVTTGLKIRGGELGVHIDENGVTYAVFGRQVRDFKYDLRPAVVNAQDAFALAQSGLEERVGYSYSDWTQWSTEETTGMVQQSEMVLRAVDGSELRFVWEVPTHDAADLPYTVMLDATTGALVDLAEQAHSAVCGPPTTATYETADGVSQNGLWSWSLEASVGSDRSDFSHEATMRRIAGQRPEIGAYVHRARSTVGACPGKTYAFEALRRGGVNNLPHYTDATALAAGNVAADALWNTKQTMAALRQWFGWCGIDGACTYRASIVVDRPELIQFGSAGHFTGTGQGAIPPRTPAEPSKELAVVVYQRQQQGMQNSQFQYPFAAAASLDIIAHEWGHAVIDASPAQGFGSSVVRGELHEGFSNVLGHAAEWRSQVQGKGYQRSDWCFGEDHATESWPAFPAQVCPQFFSRADWFAESIFSKNWKAFWQYRGLPEYDNNNYYSYHREHTPGPGSTVPFRSAPDPHIAGHRLAVALFLLSEGGHNPICPEAGRGGMAGWAVDCSGSVPGLGVGSASRILMRILTRYAIPNTEWKDLADLGKLAAFDLFKNCSSSLCPGGTYSARYQQEAVNDAFQAIGYGGDQQYRQCACSAPQP